MRYHLYFSLLLFILSYTAPCTAAAEHRISWDNTRRGTWIAGPSASPAPTIHIVDATTHALPIVIAPGETSAVHRAAQFLAGDIEKISTIRPPILADAATTGPAIFLHTAAPGTDNRWEAYTIDITTTGIDICGSNPRGTAFGVYELSERLGVDPTHIFTGYVPKHYLPLAVKQLHHEQAPPTVRYRGFFHDDEDILPRPMEPPGRPDARGTVPSDWYERFFETALRLRMNMVAPYTRTIRTTSVIQMASDWGLYYTSHHYDTLLSDPYHFDRGKLAIKRGVEPPVYNWLTNRQGIIKYWKGGVDDTRHLQCIWPMGLRGTDDYGYVWPRDWTDQQKADQFNDAFAIQAKLLTENLPAGTEPLTHFTMYTEMLPYYQAGLIKLPEDTIVVWPDDNDGRMRGLPPPPDDISTVPRARRNGVYYHLAYYGSNLSKQLFPSIPPARIAAEFRKILHADATDFMLVNVSELREFLMGSRMLADICWNGHELLAAPEAADKFLDWYTREYFGDGGGPLAAAALRRYYSMLPHPLMSGYATDITTSASEDFKRRLAGKPINEPAYTEAMTTMTARLPQWKALAKETERIYNTLRTPHVKWFFYESVQLPATYEYLSTVAALDVVGSLQKTTTTLAHVRPRLLEALLVLDQLQQLYQRANRWPFEDWYAVSAFHWRNRRTILPRQFLVEVLVQNPPAGP